jgi:hypothetical protein
MLQFLKRHIIKAISSLRRDGRQGYVPLRPFRQIRKMRNYA